jgi:hypothetical protein
LKKTDYKSNRCGRDWPGNPVGSAASKTAKIKKSIWMILFEITPATFLSKFFRSSLLDCI